MSLKPNSYYVKYYTIKYSHDMTLFKSISNYVTYYTIKYYMTLQHLYSKIAYSSVT